MCRYAGGNHYITQKGEKKIIMTIMIVVITTIMNDNNHRTRIDRFKGVEASLRKRLVAHDGNVEKTNGELLLTPSALGWLYPADR